MKAPGVSKLSPAQPLRGLSIPLGDGLGEVRIERLEDGAVRITDSVSNLMGALEFSSEEWTQIVEHVGQ
jgi:hypothetical protein